MRKMTIVSTSLFSLSASVIQVRLLYGYGNANENMSFFHYANQLVPSLMVRFRLVLPPVTLHLHAILHHALLRIVVEKAANGVD